MSVICAKSATPAWWIQWNTWRARNGFSPSSRNQAVSPARSRSSRFCGMDGSAASVNFAGGEEVGNLDRSGFRRVGSVHGVGVDTFGKVGADRARLGLLRVGRTHQRAVLGDRVLAF